MEAQVLQKDYNIIIEIVVLQTSMRPLYNKQMIGFMPIQHVYDLSTAIPLLYSIGLYRINIFGSCGNIGL